MNWSWLGCRAGIALAWIGGAFMLYTTMGPGLMYVRRLSVSPESPRDVSSFASVTDLPGHVGKALICQRVDWFDTTFWWHAHADDTWVKGFASLIGAREAPIDVTTRSAFLNQPPFPWRPDATHRFRFFKTPYFEPDTGGSGGHYLIGYDTVDHVVWVWLKVIDD